MNKLVICTLIALCAPASAYAGDDSATVRAQTGAVHISAGAMIYTGGYRLAPVYRISNEGNAQIVLDGKLVTIPAATLSTVDGKLTTSLTKKDLNKAQ